MTSHIIMQGDAWELAKRMPSKSVQCIVTSPPYWSLRDYGTASWEGGDPECDHAIGRTMGNANKGGVRTVLDTDISSCSKCGAKRVDSQFGLEQTPDEYVGKLVALFRELRRVLRDDGVVFINLGDSYFGSGGAHKPEHANPGISRSSERDGVPHGKWYDSDGKAKSDYQDRDYLLRSPYDEHRDVWWSHIADTDCRHALSQVRELSVKIQGCMDKLNDHLPIGDFSTPLPNAQSLVATLGLAQSAIHEVERPLSFLESMPVESFPQPLANFRQSGNLSSFLSLLRSFSPYVQVCARKLDGVSGKQRDNRDISLLFEGLAHHSRCIFESCYTVLSWLNLPPFQPHYTTTSLKPKDLVGIPWRVAFALQADGWWLRSDIIWAKGVSFCPTYSGTSMPESVSDRPSKSHEYLFLLTKSARYFYDNEAVKERAAQPNGVAALTGQIKSGVLQDLSASTLGTNQGESRRNLRSVWVINPKPYKAAHFATYPPALITPCILAGTSEVGNCPECGNSWKRIVEKVGERETHGPNKTADDARNLAPMRSDGTRHGEKSVMYTGKVAVYETTGWQPTCECGKPPVPAVVLDPFAGSGTTLAVALQHGRHAVGFELNPEYIELAEKRIAEAVEEVMVKEAPPLEMQLNDLPLFSYERN